jgi:hypothetical protein
MRQLGVKKLQALGLRHPGLVEKVDAMFDTFATIDAVKEMILAEYGERLSYGALWNYKKDSWSVRRKQAQAAQAAQTAWQELASEGGN